jgi:hypothetical protein
MARQQFTLIRRDRLRHDCLALGKPKARSRRRLAEDEAEPGCMAAWGKCEAARSPRRRIGVDLQLNLTHFTA